MVRAGTGDPEARSWPRPSSTVVLLSKFSTHRSPLELNASEYGPYRDPVALSGTVEVIETAGGGEPCPRAGLW
jgi:hypothetical protein